MKEGGIVITEAYDYPDRGEQEGREYTYHLEIPAAYARTFLARLAREGHRDLPLDHTDKQQGLVALFKQLVEQGVLASIESATARQNLETLISWREQEQILYEKSTWSW